MQSKVFIGVGHGGADPGAVANGYVEKDINLKMAKYVRDYLEMSGVSVMLSREQDEGDTTKDEVTKCKTFKPDVSLEIHNNAGGGNGFECYVRPNDPTANALANRINECVSAAGFRSRGVKTSTGLRWVNSGMVCAVLTEGFFLDGAQDSVTFRSEENIQKLCRAYANAILDYLHIPAQQPLSESEKVVMEKYGFAEDTVRYLSAYKYGSSLIERLANYGNNNSIH